MILHAFERNQRDKDHRVEFQITDVTRYNYEPNSFDAVFSRDCVQHITNIGALLQNIFVIFVNVKFKNISLIFFRNG